MRTVSMPDNLSLTFAPAPLGLDATRSTRPRWSVGAAMLAFVIGGALAPPAVAQQEEARAHEEEQSWIGPRSLFRPSHRRDNGRIMELVRPLCDDAGRSTVQVFSGSKPVALGLVVAADGLIVTKRSELSGDPIRVRLPDRRFVTARVAAVRREDDLALLQADAENLHPATIETYEPPVGSFLVTVGRGGRPLSVGVVSVASRPIAADGRLGVQLGDDASGAARVEDVVPSSGAEEAGILRGDKILAVDGQRSEGREDVVRTLRDRFPGESVRLTIARGDDQLELDAQIRELSLMWESENDARLNGPRNHRLSGFDAVIQHDTVLDPDQCGGPIVDSQGRVVGLNIARAGRVVSYALPSSLVAPLVESMIEEARRK